MFFLLLGFTITKVARRETSYSSSTPIHNFVCRSVRFEGESGSKPVYNFLLRSVRFHRVGDIYRAQKLKKLLVSKMDRF
ncbi:hypothetical protein OUZ56_017004 [Daphnia magna]|uniref:Secreted protein n=1 Tax=Daphnia magna TaxID=35525 RepID=A0ABR0ARW5_9CRUS|nr:hypothetical protein OUZ56_017004 [Daphnia magna]